MDPILDANMIYVGCSILDGLGLKGKYVVKINTL